VKEEEEEN